MRQCCHVSELLSECNLRVAALNGGVTELMGCLGLPSPAPYSSEWQDLAGDNVRSGRPSVAVVIVLCAPAKGRCLKLSQADPLRLR